MPNCLRKLTLLPIFLLAGFFTKAQIYQSYILDSTIVYKWEDFDAALPTEILALAGEDEVYTVPLPFTFRFFDTAYNVAFIGLNGYISFGKSYYLSDFNREHLCYPVAQLYNPPGAENALNPDNFIAAYWNDLFIDPTCLPPDGVMPLLGYRTSGTAPNREFIVCWDHFMLSADGGSCVTDPAFSSLGRVQLRLKEGSDKIEVHIRKNLLSEQEATIAVENAAGTYAVYANCAGDGDPNPGDSLVAFGFNPSTLPPTGGGGPPTGYCAAAGEDCSAGVREINKVTLSNLSHTSTCSATGYSDYTNVGVANLDTGVNYQITVNVKEFGNPLYTVRAWFDWNRDSVFNAVTELVQLVGTDILGVYTGIVTVADTVDTGLVRMRVRLGAFSNNIDPCGTGTVGEVEDYHVLIGYPQTTYCNAVGGDCSQPPVDPANPNTDPNFDRINIVTIQSDNGNIVNNSGCNNGYGDFTNNQALWAQWTIGLPYTVTVEREILYLAGQEAVWVDWNNDLDFTDPDEKLLGSYDAATGLGTFVGRPADGTLPGAKRMRVRITNLPETPAPCGQQFYGEVEDYTIIVIDSTLTPPPCVSSTFPADNSVDHCQRITLRWNAVAGVDGYRVDFSQENPNLNIIVDSTVTDTFLVLPTLLQPGSMYKWTAIPFNSDGDAIGCDTIRFQTSADGDPTANITPAFDPIFQCQGNPQQLNGNPVGGTAPLTHRWNGTNNSLLSDTTIADPVFAGAQSGSYTYNYRVEDSKGCFGEDNVTITIIPAVNAGKLTANDSGLCIGESTIVRHTGSTGNITLQDSITGQPWGPSTLTKVSATDYSTGALNQTRYYRAITSAGNCADTSEVLVISVNPIPAAPIVAAAGSTSFCENGSVILYTTNYTSGIKWDDASQTQNDSVVITRAGSFKATYTDANGCSATSAATTTSTIPAPNKPQIQVLGSTETCIGDTLTLFVNNPNNDVISWNDVNNTQNDSLRVFSPGSYRATARNSTGCTTTSDALVLNFDYEPEKPVIRKAGEDFLCTGDSVLLISSYTSGIRWNTGSTNDTLIVYQTGSYNVTYTTPAGCSSTSGNVFISIGETPDRPSVIQVGDSLISSVSGFSYQWIGPEGPIEGANSISFRPRLTGEYRVVVFTSEGCSSEQSAAHYFDATGISTVMLQGISIYPNPGKEALNITIENPLISEINITIYNSLGSEILTAKLSQIQNRIDISALPSGSYYMRMSAGELQSVRPVIIAK